MTLWRIERSDLFVSSYRKLPYQIQGRVDEAILHLATSEDPADAGVPKKGRLKGYLAYELGRSYRLIYKVISRAVPDGNAKCNPPLPFSRPACPSGAE